MHNGEYELAAPSGEAGCGCCYPEFVEDGVVTRSNRIIERLQSVASGYPEIQRQLKALARWRCMIFGGLKVLILHGDPDSLAGRGLSREVLTTQGEGRLLDWFGHTDADLVLCSHTCLPLMWAGAVAGRRRWLVNNGSAGMANLAGAHRGLIARVGATKPLATPVASLAGAVWQVSLLPVEFLLGDWLGAFDELWAADSPPLFPIVPESFRVRHWLRLTSFCNASWA